MLSILNMVSWYKNKGYKRMKEQLLKRNKTELINIDIELQAFLNNEDYKQVSKENLIYRITNKLKKIEEVYKKNNVQY